MIKEPTKTEQAMEFRREAAMIRNAKQDDYDCLAEAYDRTADDLMEVDATSIALVSSEVNASDPLNSINTLDEPDAAAVEASCDRTRLLRDVNATEIGIDTANTIQAQNSVEKMLAHQMAACHKMAFELMSEVMRGFGGDQNTQSVIEARKLNSANRLMQTYQQAMLTLQKVRTGGKQTVVVQHVNVNDGGQAVVAGNVGRGKADGGEGKK